MYCAERIFRARIYTITPPYFKGRIRFHSVHCYNQRIKFCGLRAISRRHSIDNSAYKAE